MPKSLLLAKLYGVAGLLTSVPAVRQAKPTCSQVGLAAYRGPALLCQKGLLGGLPHFTYARGAGRSSSGPSSLVTTAWRPSVCLDQRQARPARWAALAAFRGPVPRWGHLLVDTSWLRRPRYGWCFPAWCGSPWALGAQGITAPRAGKQPLRDGLRVLRVFTKTRKTPAPRRGCRKTSLLTLSNRKHRSAVGRSLQLQGAGDCDQSPLQAIGGSPYPPPVPFPGSGNGTRGSTLYTVPPAPAGVHVPVGPHTH